MRLLGTLTYTLCVTFQYLVKDNNGNPLIVQLPNIATFTVLRKEFNPVSFFNSNYSAVSGNVFLHSLHTVKSLVFSIKSFVSLNS